MKKNKPTLRFAGRVRVTDKDSFLYGLVGTLKQASTETYEFVVALDEDDSEHWVHGECLTSLSKADPEYEIPELRPKVKVKDLPNAKVIRLPVAFKRRRTRKKQ